LGVLEMAATHHDALATITAELRPAERAQAAAGRQGQDRAAPVVPRQAMNSR